MTRQTSLAALSEIIELQKSPKPLSELEPEIKECLSKFSFLLVLTSNDATERQMLSNSLSIWTKINEAIQVYMENTGKDPQTTRTPLICYRTRLIRGVILLARNLIVGLRSLLLYSDAERADFYSRIGIRNKDISGNLLIQSLYVNHSNNIIPLCLTFLDIIKELEESGSPEFVDVYYNAMVACFEYLTNITNISTDLKKNVTPDYNADTLLEFLSALPTYWDIFARLNIVETNLLLCVFIYFRNLFNDDELLSKIFHHHPRALVNLVGTCLLKLMPSVRNNEKFTEEQLEQLEIVSLSMYVNMVSHEGLGPFLIKAASSGNDEQAIVELLRTFQIILTSKENGWDKLKLVNIVAWLMDYFKFTAREASALLEKKEPDDNEKARLSRLHSQTISVLDSLSSLTQYDEVRQMLNHYHFLSDLIPFFRVVERNTFKKKLKDDQAPPHAKYFPQVKLIIVEIITALVYENFENQELMRNIHGLELILNNCNLDAHEPFIKERAILCIKYLLQDNPRNQEFVAKLEAKGTSIDPENEAILEQAGFEVNIEDGKVKLKKSTRLAELEQSASSS
ncbi:hypothetical protein KL935_001609 [Ogataea polymorpha]|uniref:Ataxin-10 homolog n=1 Tax=Ogataea polymorpha TaxID=460523 RepID=A0A1B7SJC2_9ASCO|nr:uncharacterized protein OGAPODRAFT_16204 [Ogataea polymorpha]KAG7882453.1 hypothetical protein KL937_001024 [Ogataea polymorpha]KAG7894817.1 hypothetical protein KL908_001167 [Ogataea polymorpha]KAG7902701.1 hypothetical protein KL935_001609 [Ogataea polymorpha]KAG7911311.1 hypothetical protein KL906_000632 [Ogataea polymorpha]KAG7912857.1 hypothetical protein KL907_001059 [Ogataea polymorpha]